MKYLFNHILLFEKYYKNDKNDLKNKIFDNFI